MSVLHNTIDKRVLKRHLHSTGVNRLTLSFYKYLQVDDPHDFRNKLYRLWSEMGILGRVYVAHEGINAQISVEESHFEDFKKSMETLGFSTCVRLNAAIEDNGKSFFVLKIQVKKKIVADGLHDESFNAGDSGQHLTASAFNEFADRPDSIIVDMRNHYESEVGHFKNALCPDVDTFKESLTVLENLLKDKKKNDIILYCTGGIRCEKASAWLKHKGFENVFQLDGGIIEYARQARAQGLENKFLGKNFVFDERLGERISSETISVCHQCGRACDSHTNCNNKGCHLLFIQCENCAKQFDGCCSEECKEINAMPIQAQRELRKGKAQGRMVYKKGRSENIKYKRSATSK